MLGAAVTAYLFAFLYLGPSAGPAVTALYALPCVVAGWAFGASSALLTAAITLPVHVWLFASGILPGGSERLGGGSLGLAAALALGLSVGATRDLRERLRERTAELSASETRYRDLIDNSPEGVLVHERGVIVFANPSMARLVGASGGAGALIGRTVVSLAPFEDRESLGADFVFAVAPAREPLTVAARLSPAAGSPVEVVMTSMPITYRNSRASLVLVRERALMREPVRVASAPRREALAA